MEVEKHHECKHQNIHEECRVDHVYILDVNVLSKPNINARRQLEGVVNDALPSWHHVSLLTPVSTINSHEHCENHCES